MDWLMAWPSLAKLAAVLAVMLLLVRLKVNIGWALCFGAILCGLWFGQQLLGRNPDGRPGMAESVWTTVTTPKYIVLVCMIMLILVLNHTLQQSGQIERIVASFFQVCRRPRTTLVFFPALLGLLPMPGGALFSAPMVETAGGPMGLGNRDKTLINYWFRHIWEYSWPLYPGLILAASMSGYTVGTICLYQFPLLVVVVAAGYLLFIRGLTVPAEAGPGARGGARKGAVAAFLRQVAPIWLVILLYILLRVAYHVAPLGLPADSVLRHWLEALPIVVAIVLTILYTWATNVMGLRAIARVFWQKDMLDNLVIALGIIVFAGVLAGSGAAESVAGEFKAYAVPIWLVAMVLPFAVGAISGITMNMVALTYPVILSALEAQGLQDGAMGYLVLAFACGYGGILLTPIHICMVQSNHYFKLNATATLPRLIAPVACLMGAGVLLFLLYTRVFPLLGRGPGPSVFASGM